MRSSVARNVLGASLVLPFTAHTRPAIVLLGPELILLRSGDGGSACSFFEGVNSVNGYVFKFLKKSTGPAYFYPIDFGSRAQTEVHAHVVVGVEAGAAAYLINEGASAGSPAYARADSIAIRLSADDSQRYPVIG